MTKRMPPVPPANRSPKGPGDQSQPSEDAGAARPQARDANLKEQGGQGNIHENTHHQGHQQDR